MQSRLGLSAVCAVLLSGCAITNTMTGKYTDKIPVADNMKDNYVIDEGLLKATLEGKATYASASIDASVRNKLQDSIIAKSNYLCALYKDRLRLGRAHVNFLLGTAATGTAAASAIVTGGLSSDILAGTAAFLTGTRSGYNDAYFEQLSMQIVIKGIDSRRKSILQRIDTLRKAQPTILVYTAQRAVADAMEYHMSCSISAALEEATDKIDQANNPTLESTLENFKKIRELNGAVRAASAALVEEGNP